MEARDSCISRIVRMVACFVLIAVWLPVLFAQTPTSFDAHNKTILEKLHNIPLRVSNAVTEHQAGLVAKVWLHICPDLDSSQMSTGHIDAIIDSQGRRAVAFVVHVQPQGFIIIAAHNEIRPIIGYSKKNNFSMDESCANAALSMVRTGLSLHIAALQEGAVRPSEISSARARWQEYLAYIDDDGEVIIDENPGTLDGWDVEVGPLLTSNWSQSKVWNGSSYDAVWNYYTPPYAAGDPNNYVCGCVATAMGQILNYYEWPISGTGSHTYTWDNGEDPAQELSANFGATTYDWANTLDNYYTSTTDVQRQSAGLLTYQCGVSVNMNYASSGSGANTSRVATSLGDFFRTSALWRPNDDAGFFDDLYSTIINERPGEMSIGGECGGHAIVCDGVHHNTGGVKYYHLNFGWGGSSDGWYDISTDFEAGGCNWDEVRGCVIQVIPVPDLDDPGTTVSTTSFPVSWQVASLINADKYELQQSYVPETLSDFFDGAEDGGENWTISGDWEVSSARQYTGSYSFRGFVGNVGYSTMQLKNAVKIDATSSMTYQWGVNYQINTNVHLQVSPDGGAWTTLKTYDQEDEDGSINWTTENSIDLSAYVGENVYFRFVFDYQGGGYYSGTTYDFVGFFLDDISITNCAVSDDWQTVDDNIGGTSYSVTVAEDGDYNFRVRAYADGGWHNWSDIEDVTLLQPPTIQATDIYCTEPGSGSLCINWTRGNGNGNIVFMCLGSTGEANPVDNVYYTADAEFGAGDQIGASGWYCVYDGTGTTVTVTGLPSDSDCRIHVCEYNLGSIVYNKSSSSGNPITTESPIDVALLSLSALYEQEQIRIEWTTALEINVAGFNILSADQKDGRYARLNQALIQAGGSVTVGQTYSYVDPTPIKADRWYRLETVNLDGSCELSKPVSIAYSTLVEQDHIPIDFALHQNHPNPFNPHTMIRFDLPAPRDVTLAIFDARGRLVRTLVNGPETAGVHTVIWDGCDDAGHQVSSGLYLCRIKAGEFGEVSKMTFLK